MVVDTFIHINLFEYTQYKIIERSKRTLAHLSISNAKRHGPFTA